MSKFTDLENLERTGEEALYELTTTIFINNRNVIVFADKVRQGESMRIDKICNRLYNNTDHNSFLLSLNNILNPFNIKEGDLFIYVEEENIGLFKAPAELGEKVRERINKKILDKKQQIDQSRSEYLNRRKEVDPLPPNIKQEGSQAITTNNGVVKIILDKDQSEKAKNSN